MKKNEKRLIVVLVLAVIIVMIIGVLLKKDNKVEDKRPVAQQDPTTQEEEESYTTKLEDGTKINISDSFNNTKTYKNLEISNIQFTEKNGMTVLLADVLNKDANKHEPEIVKILVIGDNNEIITEIKPVIGTIEANGTAKLNASITADVANAKDFKIEPIE